MGEPVPSEEAARYVIGLGLTDALRTVAPRLPIERHSELAAHYRKRLSRRGARHSDVSRGGSSSSRISTAPATS